MVTAFMALVGSASADAFETVVPCVSFSGFAVEVPDFAAVFFCMDGVGVMFALSALALSLTILPPPIDCSTEGVFWRDGVFFFCDSDFAPAEFKYALPLTN